MARRSVSWFVLPAALFLASAAALPAQQSSAPSARPPTPDIAAADPIDNMYVPPVHDAPFSAQAVGSLSHTLPDGSTAHFDFFGIVARDSAGRIYFENRRPLPPSGDP
ncbi:MAG: hypothetical protein WCD23_16305, partial [Candidatus Acidiferrales bacterium]